MNNNFNHAPIEVRIEPNQLEGVEYFRDFAGMLRHTRSGFVPIRELIELSDKVGCMTDTIVNIRTFGTDGPCGCQRADGQARYDLWYKVMLKSLDEAVWSSERFRQQVTAVLNGEDPDGQSPDTYGDMVTALQDAVSKYLMAELWAIR